MHAKNGFVRRGYRVSELFVGVELTKKESYLLWLSTNWLVYRVLIRLFPSPCLYRDASAADFGSALPQHAFASVRLAHCDMPYCYVTQSQCGIVNRACFGVPVYPLSGLCEYQFLDPCIAALAAKAVGVV